MIAHMTEEKNAVTRNLRPSCEHDEHEKYVIAVAPITEKTRTFQYCSF
jgi:hypothetical protein